MPPCRVYRLVSVPTAGDTRDHAGDARFFRASQRPAGGPSGPAAARQLVFATLVASARCVDCRSTKYFVPFSNSISNDFGSATEGHKAGLVEVAPTAPPPPCPRTQMQILQYSFENILIILRSPAYSYVGHDIQVSFQEVLFLSFSFSSFFFQEYFTHFP